MENTFFIIIWIKELFEHQGQENHELEHVAQVLTLEVADSSCSGLDALVTEEEELSDVADDEAHSADEGVIIKDNDQKRDDKEQDVENQQSNKEYKSSHELVIDDFLDSVLLIKLYILFWLNHQLGQV